MECASVDTVVAMFHSAHWLTYTDGEGRHVRHRQAAQ